MQNSSSGILAKEKDKTIHHKAKYMIYHKELINYQIFLQSFLKL